MKRSLGGLCALVLFAACGGSGIGDDDAVDECAGGTDPVILFNDIEDGQPVDFPVEVLAQVTDPEGINTVSLYFRTEGAEGFSFTFMSNEDTGDPTIFRGEISGGVVKAPGVDWYLRATDQISPCTGESFSPSTAPEGVHHFSTSLDLSDLPFYEDFEIEGGIEEAQLADIGWANWYQSFQQGIHNWRLDQRVPLSGETAVSHSEGVSGLWDCPPPEGEGSILRKNWLISPPLDLRAKTDIAARWFERRIESGQCAESHRLYVSTGSSNPDDGAFELVAELPLPGGSWAGSGWYDLSQYAGSETAYLALYYEGGAADRWIVDDLYVGEPLADLVIESAGPLAPSVGPGSSVSLSIELRNQSPTYGADALSATLSTADEDLLITQASSSFPALLPGEIVIQDGGSFDFDVLPDHPDNSFLDFALQLDDGAGHVWTVPIRLLMGSESTVRIDYTALGDAAFDFELGYGPVVAPTHSFSSSSGELAGTDWQLEITEHAAFLPPGPGPRRWYLRAENTGGNEGTLDGLTFTVGGEQLLAEALPRVLQVGESALIYLPEPPALAVQSFSTSPDPAGPGGTISIDQLVLRNDGQATVDAVGCILGSSAADATAFSTTPVFFGTAPIERDGTASADGAFSFDLAASHTDNSPIPLTLICTDGADTLAVSFDLPVPYAHPVLSAVRIDDAACATCDENGYADAGEEVLVYLSVRNEGALPTGGALTGTIAEGAGSTASYALQAPSSLGFGGEILNPGDEIESPDAFTLTVGADGLMGDSMWLDLELSSGGDLWAEPLLVEVSGIPWVPCPAPDDPQDDVILFSQSGGEFDIKSCDYRSDRELLQVRLNSWQPFTTSVAFVTFYIYEVPEMYLVESVAGTADFETGCYGPGGVNVPPDEISVPLTVDLSAPSAATLRVALDDLDEIGNSVQVGFAAGSCPGTFFCDTYPDGAFDFNLNPPEGVDPWAACYETSFIAINW